MLRLELELQYQREQQVVELQRQREQQAAERENFRLQLENLILCTQRGLPPSPPEAGAPTKEEEQ